MEYAKQAQQGIFAMTDKERIRAVIDAQPEDASYDDIVRELAFARMIDRGLQDARAGLTISNEEMGHRIATWRK